MTTGRRPKPTAIKRLSGNPGHRRLNDREPPIPPAHCPRAPRGLSPEARRFWRRIVPLLTRTNVLTEADLPALAQMAELYAVAQRAERELAQAETLTGSRAFNVLRDAVTAFRHYAVEFGLTPASRSKVNVIEERETSLADELGAAVEEMLRSER